MNYYESYRYATKMKEKYFYKMRAKQKALKELNKAIKRKNERIKELEEANKELSKFIVTYKFSPFDYMFKYTNGNIPQQED